MKRKYLWRYIYHKLGSVEADNEMEYGMLDTDWVWLRIHACGRKEKKAGFRKERSNCHAGPQNLILSSQGKKLWNVHSIKVSHCGLNGWDLRSLLQSVIAFGSLWKGFTLGWCSFLKLGKSQRGWELEANCWQHSHKLANKSFLKWESGGCFFMFTTHHCKTIQLFCTRFTEYSQGLIN